MKTKLITLLLAVGGLLAMSSCLSKENKTWNDYEDWRTANNDWLEELELSGKYTRCVPVWNTKLNVSMRWLNDREENAGNLTPLYTSQVKVKYKGWLYDGTPFDSSYTQPDSCAILLPSNLIDGWVIALERMKVGDKVELIVPYQAAYQASGYGSVPPFSNLRFEMELRDIPAYEIKP